jgi:hypothetical protein
MHRRLVRILSLLLSAVLLAVLAIGAVAAWNLKNGFSDYSGTCRVDMQGQVSVAAWQCCVAWRVELPPW